MSGDAPDRSRARRLASRAARAVRGAAPSSPAAPPAPVVTVVVPVHNVESWLAECLESILGQTFAELEVIAVDDGSTDGSLAILRDFEARDPRVRVLTQPNSGQGIARNRAVDVARGEFLLFCDSDDVVPRRALAHMVATLRRTGSDFCVGATRRFTHTRKFPKSWRGVHDRDVLATTIDDFPAAMQDIIACNRMFRTEFWRDRVPPFRGHIAYEDHVPMLAAYVRARRFDSLARVTYLWRVREDNTSTGQQKANLENLLDRIAVKEEARALLEAEASSSTYDAWVARTLEVDYQSFIRFALGADDMYRSILSAAFATTFRRSSTAALDQVTHRSKVRGWLCAIERWDAVVEAEAHIAQQGRVPRATLEGARLVADPDPRPDFLELVPEQLGGLSVYETNLVAGLRLIAWRPDGDLELVGYAFVRGLDSSRYRPEVSAWLYDEASGAEIPLATRSLPDPRVNAAVGTPQADYSRCGLEVVVPTDEVLASTSGRPTVWTVRLRASLDGLVREGVFDTIMDGSAAIRPPGRSMRHGDDWVRLEPALTEDGVAVTVAAAGAPDDDGPGAGPGEARAVVEEVRLEGDHLVVELDRGALGAGRVVGATLTNPSARIEATSVDPVGGRLALRLPATLDRWRTGSALPLPLGRYQVKVTVDDGAGSRTEITAHPGADLLADLPAVRVGEQLRADLRIRRDGVLVLAIVPPLDPADSSPHGQHRLRTAYQQSAGAVPAASVLLMSQQGRQVDGNPLAIDRELARTRPDLRRLWGVRSLATAVPDGAEPVVVGTPRWYDVLASTGFVCVDDDLEPYFRKQLGQRVLQTFRGRPFKALGRTRWEHEHLAPERISHEAERRRRDWDAVLAPDADAASTYRRELDYDGPVILGGTPRCDALLTADRDAVRRDLLGRLGIAETGTVVLYAPTYRDTFSPRVTSAGLPQSLDLRRLTEELGPETTVLLRAHPYDRRDAARAGLRTSVVDVTDHPDVATLMLAADVAVLDYSSLRFDWALTGRPAVCFVPDLADVVRVRPFLEDYAPTAPGPVVTTIEEVLRLLRDLPALARRAAGDLERVNARYNSAEDGGAAARVVREFFTR